MGNEKSQKHGQKLKKMNNTNKLHTVN